MSTGTPYDVAIVGGGIVGLATALRLQERRPGLRLVVVEKEPRLAAHQSSHNSGVLHSGVYYKPGSLKARLCIEGKRDLEAFAERHGIPVDQCGKVIVAVRPDELGRLEDLRRRAVGNGVADVREVGPDELREIEPHAAGIRAVHVPGTAIVDFARVAEAYGAEVAANGGDILLGRSVTGLVRDGAATVLATSGGDLRAGAVITCCGLQSDRLARTRGRPEERIVPFRGSFYTLSEAARPLVRGLIYPVPDPTLPFLGVHLTRRIDGEVWAGPNAVLALGLESYRRTDVHVAETLGVLAFPGTWRLARRYWRTAAAEVWRDLSKRVYLRDLQRYLPALRAGDLLPGPSGIRAQAVRADGAMIDDFSLTESEDVIHVRNAPSPAATASLAIGNHLATRAIERFALERSPRG